MLRWDFELLENCVHLVYHNKKKSKEILATIAWIIIILASFLIYEQWLCKIMPTYYLQTKEIDPFIY